ncbi:hypothetical protein N7457_005747 [Penicillium paradoxum]|uniref:uncharacterized protein n=1 Tax=Penicillium paradoxum TaxID=176176 RepID=UPI0025494CCB|nr:uncharacterized protein N7457_005747 [Penicillium paradoxum]KAJ5780587.1 hypothetical protein N7457_005747 [Penicillium paradoxum]
MNGNGEPSAPKRHRRDKYISRAWSTNLDGIGDVQESEPFDRPGYVNTPFSAPSTRPSLYRSIGSDPNRTSLRSRILDARALFRGSEDIRSDREEAHRGETHSIELPAFCEIEESLRAYFENSAKQYPAIHPTNTISRIHEILECLQYPLSGSKIDIDHVAAPTIALLCIIIAIARIGGKGTTHSSADRSLVFRNHARNLLQSFEFTPPNLEVLRCYTLITTYLLHMNFLDLAQQSIAVTVRLAMTLRLHRQSPLPRQGSDSYDRNLWWTIYILDRDIACLGGIPFLVRDEEIDAPRPTQEGHSERFSSVTYITHACQFDEQDEPEEKSLNRDAMYLEVLAHLGRLWGRIWGDLLTNISESDCQWQNAELLDAQIRIFQQQLSPKFTWKRPSSLERGVEEEEPAMMQRQLIILMRINTLRLLIRRNPASNCTCLDRKGSHSGGAAISAQTIEAILGLSARHEELVQIGHQISITLVQCILYLVHIVGESNDTSGTESASASVVSAYQILITLSERCISAKEALETLDAALFHNDAGSTRGHAPHHTTATLPRQNGEDRNGLNLNHTQGLVKTGKQYEAATSTKKVPRPNGLFDCLQQRYESLDSLVQNTLPKP